MLLQANKEFRVQGFGLGFDGEEDPALLFSPDMAATMKESYSSVLESDLELPTTFADDEFQ